MDQRLHEEILKANIDLHKDEAALYDRIHPELTNGDERRRLRRLLDAATKDMTKGQPHRALDLGAGTGFVSGELLSRRFHVDAVDISAEMIQRLTAKFGDAIRNGDLNARVTDADAFLDGTDATYDVIAASSVLHHFPDYAATIRRMAAHLNPGGSLLFFHEPTGGTASGIELFLRKVDWKLGRTFLMSSEDLKALKRLHLKYDMADYHVTHGFDEDKVQATLQAGGINVVKLERYATAQTGIIRFIFGLFFPARTWSMVAKPGT